MGQVKIYPASGCHFQEIRFLERSSGNRAPSKTMNFFPGFKKWDFYALKGNGIL